MKKIKQGSFVKIAKPAHDGHQIASPRTLTSEPGQSGHDVGSFPITSLGKVVATKTFVQVLVGTSLGWIDTDELEIVD